MKFGLGRAGGGSRTLRLKRELSAAPWRRRPHGQQSRKFTHELDQVVHPITSRFEPEQAVPDRHGACGNDDDSAESPPSPGGAPLRSTGPPDPPPTRNLVSRPLTERPILPEGLERCDDLYRTHT